MRTFYCVLVACVVAFLVAIPSRIYGVCESYQDCGESATGEYGCVRGSYRSVEAKSNGGWTGSGCGYYQCVEFVKRYYSNAMHFTTSGWTGNGNMYYGSAEAKGLRAFAQDGTTAPKENDILCFGGGPSGYGHVGIITEVGENSVSIIDQNRHETNPTLVLSMTVNDGHYSISGIGSLYVQGWLRGQTCEYSSQWNSAGETEPIDLTPGQSCNFKVWFTNTSSDNAPDWANDGGYQSIELRSCNSTGAEASCFLLPVDGKPAWLDPTTRKRIVRASSSGIGTNQAALFDFWGKVPETATPGLYRVYLRPYHNSAEWIQDWGGMHFQVNVVEDPAPGPGNKADISTFYDYGGTSSRFHMYLSNGSSFDFTGKYGWWMSTNYNSSDVLASVSADVNGDGADDVVNMYDYPASRRLHVFLSTGSSFSWTGSTGWWISSSGYDPAKVVGMVSGYFNSDQYEDVAVLYAESSSRLQIHVFYSTGSAFVKQTWWDSDAVMSYYRDNMYGFTSGDYDDNGLDDICVVYHMGYRSTGEGYLTRLHVFKSTGSSFTLNPTVGWWSSPDSYEAARVHGTVSGDFNNDGIDDVALVYYMGFRSGGAGHLTRLHFFRSTGSSFAYYQIWWNPPENYEADKILHVASGDFTGDGTPDVCMMYDSTGVRLHVFRCTGSSFAMSGGYNGWWMNTGYNPSRELFMVSGHFNTGASAKLADESPPEALPNLFALSQNYPNPFNPATTISYSLPSATHVSLDVFNILGQNVATLVDEHQSAGEHTVLWESVGYASGIYLYRLSTPEAVETRKMILLK